MNAPWAPSRVSIPTFRIRNAYDPNHPPTVDVSTVLEFQTFIVNVRELINDTYSVRTTLSFNHLEDALIELNGLYTNQGVNLVIEQD
jgi:hypothetical protein